MGRLNKEGLDYHPVWVDFENDKKVSAMLAECDILGEIVLQRLWRRIYKDKGYYLVWDDVECGDLIRKMGYKNKKNEVENVVRECLRLGLFDLGKYNDYGILTSRKIQEVYILIANERRVLKLDERFLLIEIPRPTKVRSIELTGRTSDDKRDKSDDKRDKSDDKATKERKLNINENKLNENKALLASQKVFNYQKIDRSISLEKRKEDFRGAVISNNDIYNLKCLEAFFNYWSEHNSGGDLMKFELEKVFNLNERLKRWVDKRMEIDSQKSSDPPPKSRMQHNRDVGTEVLRKLMSEQ